MLRNVFLLAKPPAPRSLLRKASKQLSKPKLDLPKLLASRSGGLGKEEVFETDSRADGNDSKGFSEVSK